MKDVRIPLTEDDLVMLRSEARATSFDHPWVVSSFASEALMNTLKYILQEVSRGRR